MERKDRNIDIDADGRSESEGDMRGQWREFLATDDPARLLREWKDAGVLSAYPMLDVLSSVEQDPVYHPEGDVWEHTLLVVERADEICKERNLALHDRDILVMSALVHDVGKALVTQKNEDDRWVAYGHERAGVEPAGEFLSLIGLEEGEERARILKLVELHNRPGALYKEEKFRGNTVSDKAVGKLLRNLEPATIEGICNIAEADLRGRGVGAPEDIDPVEMSAWLCGRVEDVLQERGKKLSGGISGKDLIQLGVSPGPEFGQIVGIAKEARISREELDAIVLRVLEEGGDAREILSQMREIYRADE